MSEGKILQKLEAQGEMLEEQGKMLEEHGKMLKELGGTLGNLGGTVQTLVDHTVFVDEQLEFIRDNMVIRSEYLQDQDHITTFLKRLDEDRLFTHGRIDRIEKRLGLQAV